MDKIVNPTILGNPFNWILIYLIVAFAGLAMRAVVPATAAKS